MAYDDELRIIREMQAKSILQRDTPLEIQLPDRGLYVFPRFSRVGSIRMRDNRTIELLLETASGQHVVVPVAADQSDRLKTLVNQLPFTKSRMR